MLYNSIFMCSLNVIIFQLLTLLSVLLLSIIIILLLFYFILFFSTIVININICHRLDSHTFLSYWAILNKYLY
jgi:hypothetical protein